MFLRKPKNPSFYEYRNISANAVYYIHMYYQYIIYTPTDSETDPQTHYTQRKKKAHTRAHSERENQPHI